MPTNEVLAAAAFFLATFFAGLWNYRRKPAETPATPVITGVGLELGGNLRADQIVAALNRIADAIEGKRQASLEEMVREIRDDFDDMRDDRRRRPPGD